VAVHSVGEYGQKNSSDMSGMGSTRKGALHLKGQTSLLLLVSDTHFMQ
jgi:hypothetical protein